MVAVVVGGSFFGDNLSFISDTTIASTKTQECVMRDKFRVNSMIVVPAAIIVLGIYIFQGLSITAPAQVQTIEWIKSHTLYNSTGNSHCRNERDAGINNRYPDQRYHRHSYREFWRIRLVWGQWVRVSQAWVN